MATHIVQIERQRFICGLFWQSLSRRHELQKEAVELAKKLNFDLMVLRADRGVAAVGFTSAREGAQAGLASLGVIVSKAVAQQGAFYEGRQQSAPNWLGAFKLPDGRWAYFAVRDGAFLPNGDWIGTSDEVFERLNSDYGLGGWNAVIGDSEIEAMGFHNFYPRRIEDMLGKRHGRLRVPNWARLRPVTRRVSPRLAAAAAGVAVALLGGALWVQHYRAMLAAQQEHQLELARALLQRTQQKDQNLHPWATLPLPAQFARACLQHFTELAPGGWQLERYTCQPTGVDYQWSRNGSAVSLLLERVPLAQLDRSGDYASLTRPFPMGAVADDTLLPGKTVNTRLFSRFQTLDVPLTLTPVVYTPGSAMTPVGAKKPPPPPWRQWRLQANFGGLSPDQLASYLNEAGVRFVKLTYQAGAWSVEGVVYAN
ncbi:type 4b pilus protein PilO2 [Paraburkholderia sediminicola]|uniref:type 4b pilus protein PilO2 n=1 Tax=Paraburkholderia sediminicola TaxID=458836 RepID=UPI0038BA93E6